MDSMLEKAIIVHLPDDKQVKFDECSDGLYYLNTNKNINAQVNDYSHLSSMNF